MSFFDGRFFIEAAAASGTEAALKRELVALGYEPSGAEYGRIRFAGDMRDAATIVTNASFVSLLVRGDMPRKLGLPYKEFFIWCDDSEYTRRITDGGYIGVQTEKSVVLHKTARNYISSLKVVTAADAWKVFYGERNESFIRRKRKSRLSFFFSQINAFRTHAHRIKKRHLPKEEEQALLTASRRGLWAGFTFNPKIEYI